MEQTSQLDNIKQIKVLEAEIRESFGKVVYTQKIQDMCSCQLRDLQKKIKNWQIILSAVSTGGFLSVGCDVLKLLITSEFWISFGNSILLLISGLVSLGLLCINSYTKENDLCELANTHKQTGNNLWAIRERYIFLLTSIKMGTKTLKQIQEERILLFEETEKIYQTAPPTNSKAYQQAQKALKENEELTFSKEEIDRFLPEQLHYDSPIHQDNLQRHIIAE
ncbi:MAG: SLATT domain-containing protein [Lentisphaeria bacterium]|jgi:hypothetical protein|nr:SLATT domain-containing protein [Lentisphaeria bacterium]